MGRMLQKAAAMAAFYFGRHIDRKIDYKKLFIYGMIVSGVTHALLTYPDVYISFIFRAIHEIGDGITTVALMVWIGQKFDKTRIGGDSGIFYVLMTLGSFFGALIYGPIGFEYGYAYPLIISGIITIFCGLMFVAIRNRL